MGIKIYPKGLVVPALASMRDKAWDIQTLQNHLLQNMHVASDVRGVLVNTVD